jgi:hypothetical protein
LLQHIPERFLILNSVTLKDSFHAGYNSSLFSLSTASAARFYQSAAVFHSNGKEMKISRLFVEKFSAIFLPIAVICGVIGDTYFIATVSEIRHDARVQNAKPRSCQAVLASCS